MKDPPTKHQKAVPAKIAYNIYSKQHSYLIIDLLQPVIGAFFFYMRSCEYSKTPKRETNRKILRKGDVKFYRKHRKITHSSILFYLLEKLYPTFQVHKNSINNYTVTQR